MAEWSKALRSGRSPLLWAGVRISLLTKIFYHFDDHSVQKSIEEQTKNVSHETLLFITIKGNTKQATILTQLLSTLQRPTCSLHLYDRGYSHLHWTCISHG